MIRGIQIILNEPTVTGTDDFNRDEITPVPVTIDNVVVGQPSSEDVFNEMNLSGKRVAYNLCIPAGDTHNWKDAVVEFYGKKFRTIGEPTQYMDGFMGKDFPWNKQIKVEAYE
jgi:hypothetical protein